MAIDLSVLVCLFVCLFVIWYRFSKVVRKVTTCQVSDPSCSECSTSSSELDRMQGKTLDEWYAYCKDVCSAVAPHRATLATA
jgi:hypothetical protein